MLLHRDLQPQNILLAPSGPKLIDFGLAVLAEHRSTLTATGVVVGSVLCMPPEQTQGGQHLGRAADVYAVGAVLLYAATGHYPYTGPSWQAIARRIEDSSVPPDLSGLPPRAGIAALRDARPGSRRPSGAAPGHRAARARHCGAGADRRTGQAPAGGAHS
ncbi:protein kinase [Streptomyces sp. NPDC059785]|uniref:protein kinase domain-containing protein n=1 Tax=unclassified Streptomyces TaxID=2593676 RepID=UPI003655C7A5